MPARPKHSQPPRRRLVVIATPQSARAAEALLAQVEREYEVLGSVVVGDRAEVDGELPILGGTDDLPRIHARFAFHVALVSLPREMGDRLTEIHAALRTLGVEARFLPTIADVLAREGGADWPPTSASAALNSPPLIDMLALVGRTPHPIDASSIRRCLAGKRVLITGAGGSIGSELARLVASFGPSAVFLMERSENALFEIDRQIAARFPTVGRQAILHDVVDAEPTLRRLVAMRPHIVFHAAAHKHVPLMEDHPAHAVNNNVFGTKSLADAALAVGVERFVMISTDKAVNPSSVMGATKRMAEMYVRSLNARGGARSRFCMVRFGNVLGSACSVLPIWDRQIGEGGPVTVTDPRMTRYFMTIPEAAALVIQAAALDPASVGGADVFVLDMGSPVRILDLAERFIRAHALAPALPGHKRERGAEVLPTIEVVFSGARPGEKLHEELVHRPEELRPTPAPGVLAWAGEAEDPATVTEMIADLSAVRTAADDGAVLKTVSRWTPGMAKQGVRPILEGVVSGAA